MGNVCNQFGNDVEFEQFALDHNQHKHCHECKGCILDPFAQQMLIVWCIGCTRAGKADPGFVTWRAEE